MMPKTPSEALVDVNLLIAAIFSDHSSHEKAKTFVENLDRVYTFSRESTI
jgi:predicted nucleic acid-binding protein